MLTTPTNLGGKMDTMYVLLAASAFVSMVFLMGIAHFSEFPWERNRKIGLVESAIQGSPFVILAIGSIVMAVLLNEYSLIGGLAMLVALLEIVNGYLVVNGCVKQTLYNLPLRWLALIQFVVTGFWVSLIFIL